jgi:hypothetical protein
MDYGSAEPDPDPKEIFTDPQKKLSLILIKVDGVTRLDFRDIDWSRVWLEVFFLETQVFKVNISSITHAGRTAKDIKTPTLSNCPFKGRKCLYPLDGEL